MNKKAFCGILTAAILCTAYAPAAFAEDSLQTLTEALDFRNVGEDRVAEDGSWEWDAGSHVLTLKHLRVQVPVGKLDEKAAIILPEDSVLDVEGEDNKIYTQSFHCSAVSCEGDLFVSGDGYLEIETESYGAAAFYSEKGPIVFDEKVEINVEPAGYVIYVNDAKGQGAAVSVQDDAMIHYPDRCKDRNVAVLRDKEVVPTAQWTDYAKTHDTASRTITLTAKDKASAEVAQPAEDAVEAETMPTAGYQISVGSREIQKDGVTVYTADAAPYLRDGYTMLPLRALLEVTNPDLELKWNAATKTVYAFIENQMLTVKVGEGFYQKAAQKTPLATPAEIQDGRVFISLRDWMSMMGLETSQMDWNSETKTVTLRY